MKKIELFPHNEEGYENLANSLENNNLSFLERATGTGKSYILIKYMVEHFTNKRVLFVTLHDSMFKQLTERDMLSLGTSKEVFEKLDCILYSSISKHSAEWYYENYDCIIFDEAHHCGAPLWGETIGELRDLIKNSENKKMIGATATGIRYLDNYMDVAKEYFDDNIASQLTIAEAILKEILPAPFYININYYAFDLFNKTQKKLDKLKDYKELDTIRNTLKNIETEIKERLKTNALLKKYNVKQGEKYIIFCENIDDLKKKQEEANGWFKDIAPIEKYEAHSLQSNKKNQTEIDEFENNNNPNTIKLMFAVDMFNEGLHIKDVDGIFMTRKTASPIVYLQQLGRALSFSVRKKIIKIFDLVGNATQIDIIYNLYKELIRVAKDELEKNNENQEHFKKIIERFKIVDEGNELIEELETISRFIDENYLNREKIKRYILILKNYISITNKEFMVMLHNKEVDKEHLKIYNELRKLSDNISFEEYLELNRLGIIISDYQFDERTLKQIKIKGNLKNIKESEIKDTIFNYNLFYLKNHRRPTEQEEKELILAYRKVLGSITKKEASKYLKNVQFPLNVEELILLKDYPSKESIEEYFKNIENKYENGIILDELEKKTLDALAKLVSVKDNPLISTLTNNHVLIIDESIKTMKKYLTNSPNEKFDNPDKFKDIPEIRKAIESLHKNAIYVTNKQFETLLEMGITLPDDINMSLDERKKELEQYESFYEKQESLKRSIVKQINELIKKQKRRPDINIEEEYELAKKYNKFFHEKNSVWTKVIAKTLIEENISLTIDEKIVSGMAINNEDLKLIYNSVRNYFKEFKIDNYNSHLIKRKINILKNCKYIDERMFKIFNRTNNVIDFIFDKKEKKNNEAIKTYLFNNQALIPFCLLEYISENIGLPLIRVYKASKNNDDNLINIAHIKYIEEINKVNEYINYIKENKKRPKQYSALNNDLREYLSKASTNDIKIFCNKLNELKIPLTLEESFLIQMSTDEKEKELYNKIIQKRKKTTHMDALDSRIFYSLHLKFSYDHKENENYTDDLINITNQETKNDIIKEIKEKIKLNPSKEIDFSNIYLPKATKEELNIYRIIYLSKSYITKLIEKMEKENKPYKKLLNDKNLELIELMIKYCNSYKENLELIDKLIKLDKKIILENNNINIEEFLIEYLEFINSNNREPNIESADIRENILAEKYNILKEILPTEEKQHLYSTIKYNLAKLKNKDFYTSFIEFIESNQRFPSILGDDKEEISLAKEYQKMGPKLKQEQRKYINLLMGKYQMNTILYIEKKKGR